MKLSQFFHLGLVVICTLQISAANASTIQCSSLFKGSDFIQTESLFQKSGQTEISVDELQQIKIYTALQKERARIKDKSNWTPEQLKEIIRLTGRDEETAIEIYKQVLDTVEEYNLPEYAFIIGDRIQEALKKLNGEQVQFEGESFDLKFKYHSVNKYILRRIIKETGQTDFSIEQLAALIKAEKMYREAELRDESNKSLIKEGHIKEVIKVREDIMKLIGRYFSMSVFPNIKSVLRVILLKEISSGSCCGHGCGSCLIYPVRQAYGVFSRERTPSVLPVVNILNIEK